MLDVQAILRPWWDHFRADHGEVSLFDAHTHIGEADPDGARQTPEQLLAVLAAADARGVVFSLHEPDGYPRANDRVLQAAADSNGRLVAFCRVDPRADPLTEARRCLDAGARGIKLHPRAERFTLSEPAVRDIVALAHERHVPVLIHAGRGIPALGRDTVRLSGEFGRSPADPRARGDLRPRLALARPARVPEPVRRHGVVGPRRPDGAVHACAVGQPAVGERLPVRPAADVSRAAPAARSPGRRRPPRAALDRRRATRTDPRRCRPEPAGSPPPPTEPLDPLLERTVSHLNQAIGRSFGGGDATEPVALARLACAVGEDGPHAALFAAVLGLLDLYEEHLAPPRDGMRYPEAIRLLLMATTIARTPDVPIPTPERTGDRAR